MKFTKGMIPWIKGKKHSTEAKEKMRLAKIGKKLSEEHIKKIAESNRGKKHPHSEESKKRISLAKIGSIPWNKNITGYSTSLKGRKRPEFYGMNNPCWIKDRTKLKKYDDNQKDRRSSAYITWRNSVHKRDSYRCRIADNKCHGRIEVHHILGYTEYPELRYQLNNGITLCHAHHPRGRAEEKRLIPTFKELVSVSKK